MLKIRTLQNDQDQNVLLVVHDESGQSSDIINKLVEHLQHLISALQSNSNISFRNEGSGEPNDTEVSSM